jgi:hypothetical protein
MRGATLTIRAATRRGFGCVLLTALALALTCASPAVAASATERAVAVRTFTLGTPGVPFGFVEPLDPLFTLGDAEDEQLAFVTPLTTVPVRDVLAKTTWMGLGAPGVDKEFRRFTWTADADPGASFQVSYSVAGAAWRVAAGDGGYTFPDDSHGKTIAVRVKMSSTVADATARFDDITVTWVKWARPAKPADDDRKPGAGGNNGSGVYVYPSAAPTAQAPAQTGASSYSPGAASNTTGSSVSGAGGDYGSGAGSTVSRAATTGSGTETAEAAPVGEVPAPPVESTGEGAPTQVTGVLADQGEQVVTGVPYKQSAWVGPASGGAAPADVKRGSKAPVLLIAAATGVLALTLFGPWLFTAASLRELTHFNSRRARSRGPFGRSLLPRR